MRPVEQGDLFGGLRALRVLDVEVVRDDAGRFAWPVAATERVDHVDVVAFAVAGSAVAVQGDEFAGQRVVDGVESSLSLDPCGRCVGIVSFDHFVNDVVVQCAARGFVVLKAGRIHG